MKDEWRREGRERKCLVQHGRVGDTLECWGNHIEHGIDVRLKAVELTLEAQIGRFNSIPPSEDTDLKSVAESGILSN